MFGSKLYVRTARKSELFLKSDLKDRVSSLFYFSDRIGFSKQSRCQVAGKKCYYRLTVSLSVVFHTALLVAAYILPMPDSLPFLWILGANDTKAARESV